MKVGFTELRAPGQYWLEEYYSHKLCLSDYSGWESEKSFEEERITEKEFMSRVLKSKYTWNIEKL